MNENSKKIRLKALDTFIETAKQLRKEGATDNEILGYFNNHVKQVVKDHLDQYGKLGYEAIKNKLKQTQMSAKAVLYQELIMANIPFKQQYLIAPYCAEFLIGESIVIEIYTLDEDNTKERYKYFDKYGYKVYRYPSWLILIDPKAVIKQIQEILTKGELNGKTKTGN